MDLFLQDMNPLCELSRRQLLFLVVTGAERGTPPAAGEINDVGIIAVSPPAPTTSALTKPRGVFLPDK